MVCLSSESLFLPCFFFFSVFLSVFVFLPLSLCLYLLPSFSANLVSLYTHFQLSLFYVGSVRDIQASVLPNLYQSICFFQVVIKHNYDPKATAPSMVPGGAPGTDEQMLISPLTGERVPASKMAEHMRIGLLDPKWVEQKVWERDG